MNEKGTISVHTENIFPIIKKFLYSDQEVFLRELVSNAVDATQKLKQLAAMGMYEGDVAQKKVTIVLDEAQKTITISDQGIGMTAEEIKKYINQVAFSGATEFLEKHQEKDGAQQLIGFFGLGFYAAFMVADKVEIITKSYQKDAAPAHWTCDGTTNFELMQGAREEVGTDVVLHLSKDALEFLQQARIQHLLDKYCKFLPVPVEFDGKVANNTMPLWVKAPSDLEDKDYLAFYKELYPLSPDPLFWIHLNVDYPFNLTGVLYFPQETNNFEQHKNKIQLYTKQVFITNEVKDIVPEFLMLLHGVIDSPDIPLNVSRSALQADGNVKKINTYIAKKVAEKLTDLFEQDRVAYEEKWPSIDLFVKYGMLTDSKFYDRVSPILLLKNTAEKLWDLASYQQHIKEKQTDKNGDLVMLYASDPAKQHQYIQSCEKYGYDVLVLDQPIDPHFVSFLEQKLDKVSLKSVDAAPTGQLVSGLDQESVLTDEEQKSIQGIYENAVSREGLTWSVVAMSADEPPVVITVPEFMQRMQQMSMHNAQASLPLQAIVNANHPLVQKLLKSDEEENKARWALQAYNLGLLSHGLLKGKELTNFLEQSIDMMLAG